MDWHYDAAVGARRGPAPEFKKFSLQPAQQTGCSVIRGGYSQAKGWQRAQGAARREGTFEASAIGDALGSGQRCKSIRGPARFSPVGVSAATPGVLRIGDWSTASQQGEVT